LRGWSFAKPIIQRLNGKINFIFGGHDHRWYYDVTEKELEELNISMLGQLDTIEFPQYKTESGYSLIIVLCHYALKVWDRSHYNSLHLFGHSHGHLENPSPNSLDVGVDCHNFKPYSIEEIIEIFKE